MFPAEITPGLYSIKAGPGNGEVSKRPARSIAKQFFATWALTRAQIQLILSIKVKETSKLHDNDPTEPVGK
jgi:hypothetical protein